jgi:putative CocE/NonD family hydrolase
MPREGGRLTLSASGEKRTADYLYDPRGPMPTLGGAVVVWRLAGPIEQTRVESLDDMLTFTSERFDAELELAGAPVASLLLSSSAPATDFIARLTLVQDDGRSLPLVHGIWSGRLADFPSPGQDAPYRRCDIKLGPIHIVLTPGQRLRLQVTASC